MLNIRNRMFMVIAYLLCVWFLLFNCATEEETIRPQKLLEGINLEFVGGQIVLQNPLPRNGEEVEVISDRSQLRESRGEESSCSFLR